MALLNRVVSEEIHWPKAVQNLLAEKQTNGSIPRCGGGSTPATDRKKNL
jgi:hypothetical protein